MGRDWMLPHSLSRIHSIKRTPVLAICISGLLFIGIAVFLPLETIGIASSLLFLLTFSLVNVALIIYRRRSKTLPPFRAPLFLLFPLLGILTCLGLSIFQLLNQSLAWVLTAAWILIGLGIYASRFSRKVKIADVPKYLESRELSDLKKTRHYKILVPLANPARVEPLMQLACRIADVCFGEIVALNVIALPNITAYSEAEPFLEEAQVVISQAQRVALGCRMPFTSLTKIGRSAAGEIIRVARENRCHLILLGYKKEDDPLENSIIHNIITHQPCDVAILKTDPDASLRFKRILLPIAGKEIHDHLKSRIVHSLAESGKPQVTLLSVIPGDSSAVQRSRAEDLLNRAAKIYNLADARIEIETSSQVADAIARRAADFDLLILGMKHEAWYRSFFFRTVAQQITGQVRCPTLLLKSVSRQRAKVRKTLRLSPNNSCPVDDDD
jgi:APA family basic amino acid/polyamine antiporter